MPRKLSWRATGATPSSPVAVTLTVLPNPARHHTYAHLHHKASPRVGIVSV